jgi:adenylosuccinate lyase
VIFPDSFVVTDYLLAETTDIIRNWRVHPERMRENIDVTRGLVFSQRVLLALTQSGLSREEAYHLVQRNSLKAWDERRDFRELVQADPDINSRLSPRDIEACFSLDPYLDKIEHIFNKVFANES